MPDAYAALMKVEVWLPCPPCRTVQDCVSSRQAAPKRGWYPTSPQTHITIALVHPDPDLSPSSFSPHSPQPFFATPTCQPHPLFPPPPQANSPDRSDLLPGLCVLAQRWVADVALGSFRGTQGAPFSLEAWFEKDGVRWARGWAHGCV